MLKRQKLQPRVKSVNGVKRREENYVFVFGRPEGRHDVAVKLISEVCPVDKKKGVEGSAGVHCERTSVVASCGAPRVCAVTDGVLEDVIEVEDDHFVDEFLLEEMVC